MFYQTPNFVANEAINSCEWKNVKLTVQQHMLEVIKCGNLKSKKVFQIYVWNNFEFIFHSMLDFLEYYIMIICGMHGRKQKKKKKPISFLQVSLSKVNWKCSILFQFLDVIWNRYCFPLVCNICIHHIINEMFTKFPGEAKVIYHGYYYGGYYDIGFIVVFSLWTWKLDPIIVLLWRQMLNKHYWNVCM